MLYRVRRFLTAFSMVLALAPFSGILAAAVLAAGFGCDINDATQEPCNLSGVNVGPLLSGMTLTAGLGEIVFSILSVLLAGWAVVECLALLWQRLRPERE